MGLWEPSETSSVSSMSDSRARLLVLGERASAGRLGGTQVPVLRQDVPTSDLSYPTSTRRNGVAYRGAVIDSPVSMGSEILSMEDALSIVHCRHEPEWEGDKNLTQMRWGAGRLAEELHADWHGAPSGRRYRQ
mmetsp:Transcript_26738/g.60406  ORF Transcript_26738/g.60406 Transcript_26738/m.60406 type:complete len:133 (+) Transcript_26738:3-401(+)